MKRAITIIAVTICFLLVFGLGIYFFTKGNKEEQPTTTTIKTSAKTSKTTNKAGYLYYEASEVQFDDSDGFKEKEYIDRLYLLDDGTFWYVYGFTDHPEYAYGTYDDKELKTEKIHNSTLDCYYDKGFNYILEYTKTGVIVTLDLGETENKISVELTKKDNDEPIKNIKKEFYDICEL